MIERAIAEVNEASHKLGEAVYKATAGTVGAGVAGFLAVRTRFRLPRRRRGEWRHPAATPPATPSPAARKTTM